MATTPTKTRTRKSPAQREAEIVGAAVDLAREAGLNALTLRAIAERAGVAPGLVAHYQPSMDDLVARAYRELVAGELADVRTMLDRSDTATDAMATLVSTLLDDGRDEITVVWVEGWALARRSPAIATAVGDQMDAWQELVQQLVERGCASGEFAATSPAQAAWQLLGMIDGLNAQSLARQAPPQTSVPQLLRVAETLIGAPAGSLQTRA